MYVNLCYVDFLLRSIIFLYVNIEKLFTEMIRAFSTFNRYIIHKTLFWFQLFFVPFNFIERRSEGKKIHVRRIVNRSNNSACTVEKFPLWNLLKDERNERKERDVKTCHSSNIKLQIVVTSKERSILHRKISTLKQFAYFSFSISPYFLHFLSRENSKSKYRNMAADDRERDD